MKTKARSVWVVEFVGGNGKWKPLVAKTRRYLAVKAIKSWNDGGIYRVVRYEATK
jgi:hypothetical protein